MLRAVGNHGGFLLEFRSITVVTVSAHFLICLPESIKYYFATDPPKAVPVSRPRKERLDPSQREKVIDTL